jgi:hypothetical protein
VQRSLSTSGYEGEVNSPTPQREITTNFFIQIIMGKNNLLHVKNLAVNSFHGLNLCGNEEDN